MRIIFEKLLDNKQKVSVKKFTEKNNFKKHIEAHKIETHKINYEFKDL